MASPGRGGGGFGGGGTVDFGGMFRRPPQGTLTIMIVTGVASILAMASGGAFGSGTIVRNLLFSPGQVLSDFKIWTPLTYLFIDTSAQGLIFYELFGLWMFGASLERAWGTRRYLQYFFTAGVGAALLTTALALVIPQLHGSVPPGTLVISEALVLAWVLMNWHGTVLLIFFPVPAPFLLVLSLGVPFLSIIQGVWAPFVPVLLSMGIGFVMLRTGSLSPRRMVLLVRAWWIDRQLKRRARHLRVVPPPNMRGGDKDNGPGKYLH